MGFDQLKRRDFFWLLGAAIVWPPDARAESGRRAASGCCSHLRHAAAEQQAIGVDLSTSILVRVDEVI